MQLGYEYIWIDQYYIDQTNKQEKNTEIKRMRDDYKNAAQVLVLMPDGRIEGDGILQCVLCTKEQMLDGTVMDGLLGLLKYEAVNRPRVTCVTSKSIASPVVANPNTVVWERFIRQRQTVVVSTERWILQSGQNGYEPPRLTLVQAWEASRGRNTTNEEDRVYALLSSVEGGDRVKVDRGRPLLAVIQDCVEAGIVTADLLAGNAPSSLADRCWMPDLTGSGPQHPLRVASASEKQKPLVWRGGRVSVKRKCFGFADVFAWLGIARMKTEDAIQQCEGSDRPCTQFALTTRQKTWTTKDVVTSDFLLVQPMPGCTQTILVSARRDTSLAVFVTDSNWMKGAIVKGSSPIQTSRWDNLDPGDEQLAYLKELGMLFSYWNHPKYTANRGPNNLVRECKKFNQLELKWIVEKGKASAQYLKESHNPVPAVHLFPGGPPVSVWHDQAGSDLREFAVASDESWKVGGVAAKPEDFYDELYEQMYFVQHANQDCIVAFQLCEKENPRVDPEEWFLIAERIPRVYEYLAHSTNTPNVDVDQPIDIHPRIIKYLGRLPVGYLLEKLDPGPLHATTLPLLTTFPASRTSCDDKDLPDNGDREPLLLLYYRWALQSLAMLAFLHEHGVYVMDFSSSTIWIRDDLSIALSGFVNATIPTDEWPYSPDGTRYETEIYYPTNPDSGQPELSPKIDLSDWATFVWQLMRKDASSHGAKRWVMPTDPLDPTEMPGEVNAWEFHKQRLKEGKLQLLEEERLGPMLVKAWKGEYENAREILQEVRSYLQQIGVRMDEDEVLLDDGRKWEDVFTVVQTDGARWGREIRYNDIHR
ncbi:hypothetical protein CNMCM6106_007846 [Aspergillus hiratsukae]|uniref:Heterokaryon incompatibility domain-containing protein n=1 Tax=Aspergillus hiratsukae TaxID=1194566 RepID=A0A8H6PKF8_9EURO|nr:hypothetical protein CNMCM6106_007846 [Aspergillus hiratsukae]